MTSNSPATIKVSSGLRDRINADAREQGVTAARLIEQLLDDYERRRRMEAFGFAVRSAEAEYWDEFREWDATLPAPEDRDGDG